MKIIKELPGAYSSKVELVEIEEEYYVLKTATPEEITNEMFFNKTLKNNGLPVLKIIDNVELANNQLLMEYIPGSPELENFPTPENYIRWGEVAKKLHSITSPKPYKVDEEGRQIKLNWSDFIEEEIKAALLRQKERNTNLDDQFIKDVVQFVRPLADVKNDNFSLVHGDLHSNNILITTRGAILFDKGSDIMYGDPLYDLAQVGISFQIGLHLEHEKRYKPELLAAFIKGYGGDFTQPDEKLFARYITLRALRNHPNIFEPFLVELMRANLLKYS